MDFKPIEFVVESKVLQYAVETIAPFIKPQKKGIEDNDEDDEELTIPEPYYYDKATFVLHDDWFELFVLVNGLKVTVGSSMKGTYDGLEFCVSLPYLKQELAKITDGILRFKEELFFGFKVYDEHQRIALFDIEAFSTKKQIHIHPEKYDTLYPRTFSLEKNVLTDSLRNMAKYGSDFLKLGVNHIFYFVQNGECKVIATDGYKLAYKKYSTNTRETHAFCIPCYYADRIQKILQSRNEKVFNISYNDSYIEWYSFDRDSRQSVSIEMPRIKDKLDYSIFEKYISVREHFAKVIVSSKRIKTFLKRTYAISEDEGVAFLIFGKRRVHMHMKEEVYNSSISEWCDIENEGADFVLKLNRKFLSVLLQDIYSPQMTLFLVGKNAVYLLNEDEYIGGQTLRLLMGAELNKEEELLVSELKTKYDCC